MSVEFANAYQEVLLENLDSILKQNFMFQARLKLLEKQANLQTELQLKLDELTVKYQDVLGQVDKVEQYKVQAASNDAIVQEKNRFQSALNDTMRELSVLKGTLESVTQELNTTKSLLESKEKEVEQMNIRILELEKLIPPPNKVVKKVTVMNEEKPLGVFATGTNKPTIEAGGTF
jgi:hypothetical protein